MRLRENQEKKSRNHRGIEGNERAAFLPSGANATSTRAVLLESETDVRARIDASDRSPSASFLPLACRVGGDFVISRNEERNAILTC